MYCQLHWKDENKGKGGREWPILKRVGFESKVCGLSNKLWTNVSGGREQRERHFLSPPKFPTHISHTRSYPNNMDLNPGGGLLWKLPLNQRRIPLGYSATSYCLIILPTQKTKSACNEAFAQGQVSSTIRIIKPSVNVASNNYAAENKTFYSSKSLLPFGQQGSVNINNIDCLLPT